MPELTTAQLDELRLALLADRERLEKDLELSRAGAQPVELGTPIGRLSRMDALQTQQMALETSRRRQGQLQKIEGALRRIESGDFGDCFVCGEEIDLRRLDVDPTNTRCIRCAET